MQFVGLKASSLKLSSCYLKPFIFIFFPLNMNVHKLFASFSFASCQFSIFSSVLFLAIFQFCFFDSLSASCFNFPTFLDMAPPIAPSHNLSFELSLALEFLLKLFLLQMMVTSIALKALVLQRDIFIVVLRSLIVVFIKIWNFLTMLMLIMLM